MTVDEKFEHDHSYWSYVDQFPRRHLVVFRYLADIWHRQLSSNEWLMEKWLEGHGFDWTVRYLVIECLELYSWQNNLPEFLHLVADSPEPSDQQWAELHYALQRGEA